MTESPADAYADLLKVDADGWALWNPYYEGVVGDCGLLAEGRFFKASPARPVSSSDDCSPGTFVVVAALQRLSSTRWLALDT